MSGVKVWLVGAGPGDAGLFTLRGREVLERAEVVIFDRLIGQGLFRFMPAGAELIDAGKEGGRHNLPQREIEEIIASRARAGKRVVRLKGGDPFVFGRGGEEAAALIAQDIPFEVVPGVTSAVAAAGCAGIPATHRGLSSSLHIITGHSQGGGLTGMDYPALAALGGTLMFLMGVASLPEICAKLAASGMSKNTPAAIVERGTTAAQKSAGGTLGTLPQIAAANEIKSPAVIIVGEVAALRETFNWKKYLPLAGQKVLVTRPAEKSGELSGMLRDRGAEVIELPCIKTEMTNVVLPRVFSYGWIAFTSAAGVECFFGLLRRSGRDIREVGGAKFAAVGQATALAIRARGLAVDLTPEIFDGVHLGKALAASAAGGKVLLLKAEEGDAGINEELRRAGVELDELAVYRTVYEKAVFVPDGINAAVFTSASSVRGLVHACPGIEIGCACCIGAQTAAEAVKAGFANVRVAAAATLEHLVNEVERCAR